MVAAPIRLTVPTLESDDFAAVQAVLESGFLVQGPQVEAFEHAVAQVAGSRHAVAVTNCTAALQMALTAVGVRAGDLVVTTAYSWLSTANVVDLCGARPVFVDIEPDTYNIDPLALESALERLSSLTEVRSRIRAILPVHTFGGMADMDRIMAVADRYGIPVVEDAACALGASWGGRPAGSIGEVGCFSFHPRKAVTTGEGGMVVTDNDDYAAYLRALRNHGQRRSPDGQVRFVLAGFNNRMTEMQGALGVTQMAKLDRIIDARRAGAARYDELLSGSPVRPPVVPERSQHVYQSYVVLLPGGVDRSAVLDGLHSNGIEATIGTYHMPLTDYFVSTEGHAPGDLPTTDDVALRALTLPLHPALTPEDQERVVRALLSHVEAARP